MNALSPSLLDRRHHGLWSLWEMLKLDSVRFVGLMQFTAQMQVLLGNNPAVEDENAWAKMRENCERAAQTCEAMGLVLSAKPLHSLAVICQADARGWPKEHETHFGDAVARIRDELEIIVLLELDARERGYFEPSAPLFGSAFSAKFISGGIFELDEAAKCLALGRSTAAVFHLMRMMEIGVRAVARCLGIPDPVQPGQRNWGAVLKKIKDAIDTKWPTATAKSSGDGEVFDALYASLDAVKNPWRNATMHPANKYTLEEAEHIFAAVRGFMMKVAERLDENGDPKA
jgi:hypothetical protein